MKSIEFNRIEGFETGHAQDTVAGTGCTVILCRQGAVTGVDVRGGAPATRETDLLNPVNLVQQAHAVLLTGGSAFGLDAAAGVMAFLEERQIGFNVQVTHVPIVCGAALFDLAVGDHRIRPDREMGYRACLAAGTREIPQGSVGAGTGATVGKLCGMDRAMKGGLGWAAFQVRDLKVGALAAVNCLGDVLDPETGKKLAGLLNPEKTALADTETLMIESLGPDSRLFAGNTSLGVVVTNADLTQARAAKLAAMAQNGFARTLRPAHSMYDGDTVFAMSCGNVAADLSVIGILAARAMGRAVAAAVNSARTLCRIPGRRDLNL
ncbi:MAG TPA: P1 family peptidase [Desulfotignum sp.]|nr:P1 family peptidase [Desulfotignum sp.]